MAKILENNKGRRSIEINENEIIEIVREYQNKTVGSYSYCEIREKIKNFTIILPEE